MKPDRQSVILDIISEQVIETQNQLMLALTERGIKSTQATLSRDIKDLGLVKQCGPDGVYRYAVVKQTAAENLSQKRKAILRQGVVSFDLAQNLLVIKTLPGLAMNACSVIDSMHLEKLVGTLAGDNTAFLAMKDNESAQELYQEIEKIIFDS